MSSAGDRTALLKYRCLAADKWSLYPAKTDVNMDCHTLDNLGGVTFCNSDVTITAGEGEVNVSGTVVFDEPPQTAAAPVDPVDLVNKAYVDAAIATGASTWSQYPASQDVDVSCNQLDRVGSLAFCDGTYIGPGGSFDISSSDTIKLISNPVGPGLTTTVVVDGSNGSIDMDASNGLVRIMGNQFLSRPATLEFNDASNNPIAQSNLSYSKSDYTLYCNNTSRIMVTTGAVEGTAIGNDGSVNYVRGKGLDLALSATELGTTPTITLSDARGNIEINARNATLSVGAISAPSFLSLHQFKGFPQNTVSTSLTVSPTPLAPAWAGGVLAPNGRIYGIPYNAQSVLIYDPVTDMIDTTTIVNTFFCDLAGTAKWVGGVLAPNGKIYCIPYNATTVLVIDTLANVANTLTITGLPATAAKWAGGVLAPNGKIYCMAYDSSNFLVINPVTDTTYTIGTASFPNKHIGGVLAPSGYIYCIPYTGGPSNSIRVINTTTDTVTTPFAGTSPTGTAMYIGGVLAPNGKIYCIPHSAAGSGGNTFLVITPNSTGGGSLTYEGLQYLGSTKFAGGVLAQNGRIYCIPYDKSDVVVVDPTVTPATSTFFGSLPGSAKWYGGVLAPNGCIYGIPYNSTSILKINTSLPLNSPWMLEAAFNKL